MKYHLFKNVIDNSGVVVVDELKVMFEERFEKDFGIKPILLESSDNLISLRFKAVRMIPQEPSQEIIDAVTNHINNKLNKQDAN